MWLMRKHHLLLAIVAVCSAAIWWLWLVLQCVRCDRIPVLAASQVVSGPVLKRNMHREINNEHRGFLLLQRLRGN